MKERASDSAGISLTHTRGCATVLPRETIKEVSFLMHPLRNDLTARAVAAAPDPPAAVTA